MRAANCYGDWDNDLIVLVFILPASTLHIIRDFLSPKKRGGVNGEKYNSHHEELQNVKLTFPAKSLSGSFLVQ